MYSEHTVHVLIQSTALGTYQCKKFIWSSSIPTLHTIYTQRLHVHVLYIHVHVECITTHKT